MTTRRTFTAADPEPADHPDLVDNNGEVWCWEDDSRGFICGCGEHTCTFPEEVGWYSPSMIEHSELRPFASIFTPDRHGRTPTLLTELTAGEAAELCQEMWS